MSSIHPECYPGVSGNASSERNARIGDSRRRVYGVYPRQRAVVATPSLRRQPLSVQSSRVRRSA